MNLHQLGRPALLSLAEAFASGRYRVPLQLGELRMHVPPELERAVLNELESLLQSGMTTQHLAVLLRAIATERTERQALADRVELVWSGLEEPGSRSRDTAVVVQELFHEAQKNVLISSYAIDRRDKAEALFGHLATRMDAEPTLNVRLFLNVHRKFRDETPSSILLREFAETFRKSIWPGQTLPAVYHDPRSLSLNTKERASLHAKCILIDGQKALVTSANFTEAAQERNLEAGILIEDEAVTNALRLQFEALVEKGVLRKIPGLD